MLSAFPRAGRASTQSCASARLSLSREHGRAPSQRELAQLHQEAWDATRKQKPEGGIDFDALHSGWAERLRQRGRELESIAAEVWDEETVRRGGRSDEDDGAAQLDPGMLRRAALKALARCQAQQSKWNRYQLIHELGSVLPPQVRDLAPERMLPLLEDLADRTLAGEFEPVVCLEAPELVEVPDSLRRSDGLPVYRRHMGAKYATAAQLSTEEQLLADAGRRREPLIERERAAELLGSDVATLSAQLERKPEAGSEDKTSTGLRLDQAAAIWSALTDRKTSTVLTGPAGSGKTYTLAAAAPGRAAGRRAARLRHRGVAGRAQRPGREARGDGRAGHGAQLHAVPGPGQPPGRPTGTALVVAPGSLILVDEASMLPTGHAAAIKRVAARTGSKELTAGDQEQLQAVTEGGAMGLQARKQGFLQLAEPVRFAHPWERDASLRLRAGDAGVAEVYDQQARIRGGSPEEVLEDAAQTAVTLLADGQDVILMARARDHVRELSRRVRDELIRLGLVATHGRPVPLAEGARAGVHDLVVIRANDHRAGLANGDIVRVEAIEDDGQVLVRKVTGRDPATGAPVFADRAIARSSLRQADSAYARTVHTAQGGQGTAGLAVVTGNEDRQWLYPAMTRGTDANYAFVMTDSPRKSDPEPGPQAAPELARFDRLERMRAGLPAEAIGEESRRITARPRRCWPTSSPATAPNCPRPSTGSASSPTPTTSACWTPCGRTPSPGPRTERYRQMLLEVVPPAYAAAADESARATWLWRTLRAVEAAGLDAREVLRAAVESRDLAGARDVAAVIDDRIRKQADVERLVPLPRGRLVRSGAAGRRPGTAEVPEPARRGDGRPRGAAGDVHRRAGAGVGDGRCSGPCREAAGERAAWEAKAAPVAAFREMYGWDSPSEPIGPEPAMATPEKRAAWHAAAAALGQPADGPGLRARDTGSLLLIRDSYEAETGWAPRFVTPELRSVRAGAQHEELARARAAAEARAAQTRGDAAAAERQRGLARAAETLRDWYTARTAELEEAEADYREWEHTTEGSRALAVAADAELRRREPGLALPRAGLSRARAGDRAPSTPSWTTGPAEDSRSPAWLDRLAEARPAFREQLAERQSLRVPDPDPEYGDHGLAWPSLAPRERDAIAQPPVPQMPPAPGLGRQAGLEAGQ